MAAKRVCGWCGVDISHMQARALYCSLQHKKNAGSKRHRERNPGYYAKYTGSPARLAWTEANKDRLRAAARERQRQYREENPDAAREWWAANADKHRLYQARRRAAKVAGGYKVTDRDVRRLMARFRGLCAYCHVREATDLDHVVPLKLGGKHSIGNLLPACRSCNASKGARLLYSWQVSRRLTAYAQHLQETAA